MTDWSRNPCVADIDGTVRWYLDDRQLEDFRFVQKRQLEEFMEILGISNWKTPYFKIFQLEDWKIFQLDLLPNLVLLLGPI